MPNPFDATQAALEAYRRGDPSYFNQLLAPHIGTQVQTRLQSAPTDQGQFEAWQPGIEWQNPWNNEWQRVSGLGDANYWGNGFWGGGEDGIPAGAPIQGYRASQGAAMVGGEHNRMVNPYLSVQRGADGQYRIANEGSGYDITEDRGGRDNLMGLLAVASGAFGLNGGFGSFGGGEAAAGGPDFSMGFTDGGTAGGALDAGYAAGTNDWGMFGNSTADLGGGNWTGSQAYAPDVLNGSDLMSDQFVSSGSRGAGGFGSGGFGSGGGTSVGGVGGGGSGSTATQGGLNSVNSVNGADVMSDTFARNGGYGAGGFGGGTGSVLSAVTNATTGNSLLDTALKYAPGLLSAVAAGNADPQGGVRRELDPQVRDAIFGNTGGLSFARNLMNQPVAPNGFARWYS